jgi:hypothetical protein
MNVRSCILFPVLAVVGCGAWDGRSESVGTSELAATSTDPGDVSLAIGPIFDQGDSEWCWAFSAFHVLRTYNFAGAGDTTHAAWQKVLTPLNTQQSFVDFMSARCDVSQTGDPGDFVTLLTQNDTLPTEAWTEYYPADHASVREARARAAGKLERVPNVHFATGDVLGRVATNLRKGIPSVFCNAEHCRMIFGAKFSGDSVSAFHIADSIGGTTYDEDYQAAADELDMVMTLP